jgi:hypothetical protein
MSDILKIVIPAIIALLGTVLTVFFGYRQWKRQQDAARYGTFLPERQKTYKELWEKLEDVHIRLRTENVNQDKFRKLVRNVNSYILKRSLYVEKDDHALANQYLSKVREFTEAVAKGGSKDAKRKMGDTEEVGPEVIQTVRDLERLRREVETIRGKILERFQTVLSGKIVGS